MTPSKIAKFGEVKLLTWAKICDAKSRRDLDGFTREMSEADELAQKAFPDFTDEPWWGKMPMKDWWPGVEFAISRGKVIMLRNKV